jgi:hypothetical protein
MKKVLPVVLQSLGNYVLRSVVGDGSVQRRWLARGRRPVRAVARDPPPNAPFTVGRHPTLDGVVPENTDRVCLRVSAVCIA